MSQERRIQQALDRAEARDRKHAKRMRVTGSGVFALRKLLRQHKQSKS